MFPSPSDHLKQLVSSPPWHSPSPACRPPSSCPRRTSWKPSAACRPESYQSSGWSKPSQWFFTSPPLGRLLARTPWNLNIRFCRRPKPWKLISPVAPSRFGVNLSPEHKVARHVALVEIWKSNSHIKNMENKLAHDNNDIIYQACHKNVTIPGNIAVNWSSSIPPFGKSLLNPAYIVNWKSLLKVNWKSTESQLKVNWKLTESQLKVTVEPGIHCQLKNQSKNQKSLR